MLPRQNIIKKLIIKLYKRFIFNNPVCFNGEIKAIVNLKPRHKHTKPYIRIKHSGGFDKYGHWQNIEEYTIRNFTIISQ